MPANGYTYTMHLAFGERALSAILRWLPIKHGKHRILDKFFPKPWIERSQPVVVSIRGFDVVVDPNDLVGWHLVILRSFDPEVVEVLSKSCEMNEHEVFWDIGANKGACFCNLATQLPSLRIVAIEPQAALAEINTINLETICRGRYEYVCAGISDMEGELTLTIPESNQGAASLHINQCRPGDKKEVIKLLTAETIKAQSKYGWPNIIKIDVEGHEEQVFKSLEPCLSSGVCKTIVFENHAWESNAFENIKMILRKHGYEIYGIEKTPWRTRLRRTDKLLPRTTDYAAIHKDQIRKQTRLARLIA